MATLQNMDPMTSKEEQKFPLLIRLVRKLVYLLSPSGEDPKRMRLITISVSHYVEKVRWALDLLQIQRGGEPLFTEDAHVPGFHMLFTAPASGDKESMTPMLITRGADNAGGECLTDSTRILQYLSETYPVRTSLPLSLFLDFSALLVLVLIRLKDELGFLYPKNIKEQVLEFEEYLDQELGTQARRLVYSVLLPEKDLAAQVLSTETPRLEQCMVRASMPLVAAKLRKLLAIEKDAMVTFGQAKTMVVAVLDRVQEKLQENGGQRFLFGDRFTSADLTFAALAYPIVFPKEMQHRVPLGIMPQTVQSLVEELAEHPAVDYAHRLYNDFRFNPPISSVHEGQSAHTETRSVAARWNPDGNYFPRVLFWTAVAGMGFFLYKKM